MTAANWATRDAPLSALRSDMGESGAVRTLADRILSDLRAAGSLYDRAFTGASFSTVLTESTEHAAWRTAAGAALAGLDELAQAVDSEPATTIDSSTAEGIADAKATILARLAAAASVATPSEAAVITRAIALEAVIVPAAPLFYRREFYSRPGFLSLNRSTYGDIEERVVELVGEADAFLAVAS